MVDFLGGALVLALSYNCSLVNLRFLLSAKSALPGPLFSVVAGTLSPLAFRCLAHALPVSVSAPSITSLAGVDCGLLFSSRWLCVPPAASVGTATSLAVARLKWLENGCVDVELLISWAFETVRNSVPGSAPYVSWSTSAMTAHLRTTS